MEEDTWQQAQLSSPFPPLYMHGWNPTVNEHWTQLELIDAIFLGKQSYLCQYFLSLLFLLSLTTSREKSVSLISDIYLALIAAGERMHSIEMQVSIRRVDNLSASGNSGIVFINCFCCHCHCPSPTLSELLLFCLPLTHSHPSSSPQFWHEGHIWGWLLLPLLWNIPCVENMSGNVFSLPVCSPPIPALRGRICLRSRKASRLPWFLSGADWLASPLISGNHKVWLKMLDCL